MIDKNFMICSSVIVLYIVELLTLICYGVKVFGSSAFPENYSTKHLGTGVSAYFYLRVGAMFVNFEHGPRYHMTF